MPIVIDNGSAMMKAGHAGEGLPRSLFPTMVARHIGELPPSDVNFYVREYYVGHVALNVQNVRIFYPIEKSIITDWCSMEQVWEYVFDPDLRTNPHEHPVLLTESPQNPSLNREKMAEIFFEKFDVPAIAIVSSAALSLIASGRTTGLIVDMGAGGTNIVPIYDNLALNHAKKWLNINGRDITEYISGLISQRTEYSFSSLRELEIVADIKERLGYIALDPEREEINVRQYILPDGEVINLGVERFLAPEVLFNPAAIDLDCKPLHEAINNCIQKCEVNIQQEIYENIILSGGSSMFPGLKERLQKELTAMVSETIKVRVIAPPERMYLAWIGGSILASQPFSSKLWLWKEDYKKHGARLARQGIYSKLFSSKIEQEIELSPIPIDSQHCPLCGNRGIIAGQEIKARKEILGCLSCANRIL
ncbi:MAG: rod shape-determining protein [Candidatus Hermodarchaeota archaeon]